ncbi:DNA recombination protein RmuC [Gammaproteobacteria bacterium]|nr:DNA recombination protein RmuC [Gammaproteobacteria bacterium]
MDINSYLLILLLTVLSLILYLQLKGYMEAEEQKKDDNHSVTMESLGRTLETLQNNSNKVMLDMQGFKDPMSSLNRYLSGGTQAGVVGEWGLEAIISEILPSNQYEKDFMIIPETTNRVEFAIKMPEGLLMPVDSKFHSRLIDKYEAYIEVAEKGEEGSRQIDSVRKEILDSIKSDAEDISIKYMQEGVTVDVGIMFIMSESLNQLIDTPDFRKRNKNIGIREEIFNEHRVLIMGPNSFAAYLTSIYMGFKTISLNDKAREIVKDIGKAKKEFNKFSNSTRLLIKQAESMLNKAREQETRERAMSKVLDTIDDKDKDSI